MTRSRVTGDVGYRAYKKNFLINGDTSAAQRGGGPFLSGYTVDRWLINLGLSSVDQQLSAIPEAIFALRLYRDVSGAASIDQRIESLFAVGLVGRQATFSFQPTVTAGAVDSFNISLYYANAEDNFATQTLIETKVIDGVDVDGSRLAVTFAELPTQTKQGLTLRIEAVNTSSADVKLHNMQLEEGSSATPFEYVSPQQNLAECQRYTQVFTLTAVTRPLGTGFRRTGTQHAIQVNTAQPLRTTPNLIDVGVVYSIQAEGIAQAPSAVTATSNPNASASTFVCTTSGFTAGAACLVVSSATNDPLILDAEL